jgi:hypothetical protein
MGLFSGSQSSENGCCTEIATEPLHFCSARPIIAPRKAASSRPAASCCNGSPSRRPQTKGITGLPHPEHEEAFGLLPFQSAQFLDREVRECGGAGMIGDLNRKPDLVCLTMRRAARSRSTFRQQTIRPATHAYSESSTAPAGTPASLGQPGSGDLRGRGVSNGALSGAELRPWPKAAGRVEVLTVLSPHACA